MVTNLFSIPTNTPLFIQLSEGEIHLLSSHLPQYKIFSKARAKYVRRKGFVDRKSTVLGLVLGAKLLNKENDRAEAVGFLCDGPVIIESFKLQKTGIWAVSEATKSGVADVAY
jgi:hypothetical protein